MTLAGLVVAVAVFLVAACSETRYVPISETPPDEDELAWLSRVVAFERDPRLLSEPPRCVLLQPPTGEAVDPHLAIIVEETLLRHLARRTPRTVTGSYRDRLAREHGLSLARAADILRLAEVARCDSVLEARIGHSDAFYAVVFAGYRLGLDLRLIRVANGITLWRAHHVAGRTDGGLPLGLSAVTSAWSATSLVHDEEAVHSLVDDLARRLFVTWPATTVAR